MTITVDLTDKTSVEFDRALSLIDDLSYISYRHNRRISPNKEPHFFDFVFGAEKVNRYEERFQSEVLK